MLYPTSYLKSKGLGKVCALITDGRFSGGTSGLSICHVSPEAEEGGAIGLVEAGDGIAIDIPAHDQAARLRRNPGETARRDAGEGQGGMEARRPAQAQRHDGAAGLYITRRLRPARRGGRCARCREGYFFLSLSGKLNRTYFPACEHLYRPSPTHGRWRRF